MPYAAAGCRTFNLIPVAADDRTAIEGCARVREVLRGAILKEGVTR
jgi:hypothetical protein